MKDLIDSALAYRRIADYVILTDKNPFDYNILKNDAIIFCKTDFLSFLFENLKSSNKKYILITHHSDYIIDEEKFNRKPNCIKKWYASVVTYKHPDLIPIPIGFGIFWEGFFEPNKEYRQYIFDNCDRLSLIEKNTKTIYCNFTEWTHPSRHSVISKLQSSGIDCYTPTNKNRGEWRLTFPEYCEDMAKYKFVASPPGNGIDTHRNWESIYLGCIPIVIKNLIYEDYDLPMIQVNDYSEVTPELLKNYLDYHSDHEFIFEKITSTYWKNRIVENFKNL